MSPALCGILPSDLLCNQMFVGFIGFIGFIFPQEAHTQFPPKSLKITKVKVD